MSHVFISYSRTDRQHVFKIQEDFERRGFTTWIDEDIEHSSRWWKSVVKAIEECSAFVVIMTPEAETSEWVEREIMIALKHKKKIFGLVLEGEIFNLLITSQCSELKEENNFLPTLRWYRDLARHADRKTSRPERIKIRLPTYTQPKQLEDTLIDIREWEQYSKPSQSDFFGLAMLALAYEERGLHQRAIFFMWKANKIEPRVRDLDWMTEHYAWSEEYRSLALRIISDPEFWKSSNPLR